MASPSSGVPARDVGGPASAPLPAPHLGVMSGPLSDGTPVVKHGVQIVLPVYTPGWSRTTLQCLAGLTAFLALVGAGTALFARFSLNNPKAIASAAGAAGGLALVSGLFLRQIYHTRPMTQ